MKSLYLSSSLPRRFWGEISEFYLLFPFWDTVLHTINGFLAAAIGFSLVDLLNRSEKAVFSLSPLFMAIVAFCFSMTIGVVWEFFEFGMDQIGGLDMQKDTVIHTIRSVTLDPAEGRRQAGGDRRIVKGAIGRSASVLPVSEKKEGAVRPLLSFDPKKQKY